ncbi:HK97 family phage prohead protease [Polycladomyces sp. WAk]|uniref:HK97 family phage prohead protease n=1 Tax=Polycladomyces zharkentensis TaxID=2807616 RepID=A0ABS2WIB7_9BACL|nr:HK97 family phage prohead protease [Polycladomyces sp. WAk]MBN2909149.1 HK97 family phage prohead protease [Polycladomyces sp. WAk]
MSQKPTPVVDKNQNEIRTLLIQSIETRSVGESGTKITGLAAVYDEFTPLVDWWGDTFYERIQKGAMKDTLADGHDIFALKNHDWSAILGRTGANLTLSDTENGLFFELTPNNSTLGRDILEDVRSGLIRGCSIGFRILDQYWEERDGDWFRTITKLELREITLTPIPAYTSTSAEVRSLTPDTVKKGGEMPEISASEQEERQKILLEANRVYEFLKKQGGYY